MKVLINDTFFGPDGVLYEPGVRELPDEWKNRLPKSASVVDEDTPVEDEDLTQVFEMETLKDLAGATAGETKELKRKIAELEKQVVNKA